MTDEVKVEQVLAMLADRADYERVEIPADKRDMLFADAHAIITQLLAARPAPAEDAVLTEAMALHKRWKAAVARHDGLLQTHAVTHPAVVRSGQRCAGLYSQLSVAAIEALAAMQPRGEQQAGREGHNRALFNALMASSEHAADPIPLPQPSEQATRLARTATPETFPKDSYGLAMWLDRAWQAGREEGR